MYLGTLADESTEHALKIETWLAALESQVYTSFFDKVNNSMPNGQIMYTWLDGLSSAALHAVEMDMIRDGQITQGTAWQVEQALLASLVGGACIPPCRLNLLKTWLHPDYNVRVGCNDPDCSYSACLGNRLVMFEREESSSDDVGADVDVVGEEFGWFDYPTTDIKSIIVHNKNDRKPCINDLEFIMPRGPLVKLFLVHIKAGHALLVENQQVPMVNLFVREDGSDFSDSEFTQWWGKLMARTAPSGLPYFRPSLARTIFVEEYTSRVGADPEHWDGAAAVMGNSVRQWKATYNPSRQRRLAQGAVKAHKACMDRIWRNVEGDGAV